MVDVTANATVYPSANDVAEIAKQGRFGTEQKHTDLIRKYVENHVVSGFALPASDPDLTITVPSGEAVIDGRLVTISATTDVLLTASSTNHIFLQLSFDGNGDVDGVDMIFNITGATAPNAVKIGRAITSGTAVTSTVDERNFNPYKEDSIHGHSLDIIRASLSAGATAIAVGSPTIVISKVFSPGDFAGRKDPVKLLVFGNGFTEQVTGGPGVRTFTARLRLNTTGLAAQQGTTESGVTKFPYGMAIIMSLDPFVTNTIELTGEISGGTSSFQDNKLTILEVAG